MSKKKCDSVLKSLAEYYCVRKKELSYLEAEYLYDHILDPEWPNKDILRDRLVEGTMYLLIDFIKGMNLPDTMECASFDYNDFIQNAIMSWINTIDDCIKNKKSVSVLYEKPYSIILRNIKELYDGFTIVDQGYTKGSLQNGLYIPEFYLCSCDYGRILDYYLNHKDEWDSLSDKELGIKLHISEKHIPRCKELIEKSFKVFKDSEDFNFYKLSDEEHLSYSKYYELFYLSALEYERERLEKSISYDGEEKIIDKIFLDEAKELVMTKKN